MNADDFGRSQSVNRAVIQAHDEGILTTASLMVNEAGSKEAVELAKARPKLGIGLHITLADGHSTLPHADIPGLVNERNEFRACPVLSGLRFFFLPKLRSQLQAEIEAQIEKFRATGLPLDHIDSHHHLHMHPTIVPLLLDAAGRIGISHVRLTREPFCVNAKHIRGRRFRNAPHAMIYSALAWKARPAFERQKIRHPSNVFGLMQNHSVDESYLERLLPILPPGDSELYSHPSLDVFKHEFDALVSPRVRAAINRLGIQLIRYQDI